MIALHTFVVSTSYNEVIDMLNLFDEVGVEMVTIGLDVLTSVTIG